MKVRLGLGALLLLGSACSVINSYDEVSDIVAATGGKSGSGGSDEGGAGGTSTGGSGPTGGSDQGGSGGTAEVPDGLLVVVGQDGDDLDVVSVLAPESGEELHRDSSLLAGLAHDVSTDTWYSVSADTTFQLKAAKFNRTSKEWEYEGDPLEVPQPLKLRMLFALADRVALIAKNETDTTQADLHVFDTSNPSNIKEVGSPASLGPWADIQDAVVWRGSSVGGTVIVARKVACDADATQICLALQNYQVSATAILPALAVQVQPGKVPNIGSFALGFDSVDERVLVLAPDTAPTTQTSPLPVSQGFLYPYTATSAHGTAGSALTFPINNNDGATLSQVAFDPCTQIVFTDGPKLYGVRAIPLRGSDPTAIVKEHSHPGTGVVFDEATRSVISYGSTNDLQDIVAYELRGDEEVPSFVTRTSDWDPPKDLRALSIIAKTVEKPCEAP